jgi:hypothetical protein
VLIVLQDDCKQLRLLMQMLEMQLETNKDFELVQAFMQDFLKVL